jgi:histidinol phosphatase-like PHP family hydrolase
VIGHKRDFHIHATAYRLANPKEDHTVEALITYCAELGLDIVGIGEHLNLSSKHPLECMKQLVEEFGNIRSTITCFVCAEVDILDRNGKVTCSPELKKELGLDFLLGSFHTGNWDHRNPDVHDFVEEEFFRHLSMMEDCPQIDVVAHPWRAGVKWERSGNIPKWSFDLVPDEYQDRLIECALKHNIAIEANAGIEEAMEDGAYRHFILKLKDTGVPIAVGSDAHRMSDLRKSLHIMKFLDGLGIDDSHLWLPG